MPGLGIRCVDTNPWVTGAETCELAMALDAVGDHRRALALLADMQHLRGEDGAYWTGWVYDGDDKDVYWPVEHTTYTAAAVILAVDALGETYGHGSPGSGIMRGTSLAPHFASSRWSAAAPQPTGVARRRLRPAAGPASSPRSRPRRRRRSRGPAGRRGTAPGRRPRGRAKTSWITSRPPGSTQGAQPV